MKRNSATRTITVQPSPEAADVIRAVLRRGEYSGWGGQTRAICDAILHYWGPIVQAGRDDYQARKAAEALRADPAPDAGEKEEGAG